jgi:hypothetical protein
MLQTATQARQEADAWEALAHAGCLEDAAVAYVRERDWVTFTELQQRLAGFMPLEGTMSLELHDCPNAVLWAGMSEELTDLLHGLLRGKRLFLWPCSTLCYLVDGGVLTLPLAKRLRPGGFAKPRWVVAALRTRPLDDGRARQ